MNDKQIVDKCNAMATEFYGMWGYKNKDGFKYYEATHPQEVLVWEMAMVAFAFIEKTDVRDALNTIEDEG